MINEIRHLLKQINETYKDLFHVRVLTMVDETGQACESCVENQTRCMRCIVGVTTMNDKKDVCNMTRKQNEE